MFPGAQPFPHQSFQIEVDFLNNFFEGSAYILGPLDGPRWHVYVADMNPEKESSDQSLEVVMFELPVDVMDMFFRCKADNLISEEEHKICDEDDVINSVADEFGSQYLGDCVAKVVGIDSIVDGAEVQSFLFEPCGYSCNALKDSSYFTIHITPEPECSFVSFDTNLPLSSYNKVLESVLRIFKPKRFSVCVFVDEASPVSNSIKALSWELPGYAYPDLTSHSFPGKYNVSCAHFKRSLVSVTSQPFDGIIENQILAAGKVSFDLFPSLSESSKFALISKAVSDQISLQNLSKGEFKNSADLLRNFVKTNSKKDPFFVVDFANILNQYSAWCNVFPETRPYFSVRCNADACVLSVLNSLGCGFVCTSLAEMNILLSKKIHPESILFAQHFKTLSLLRVVRDAGIGMMVFDSLEELENILRICPNVKLLMRVSPPSAFNGKEFSLKRSSNCDTYGFEIEMMKDSLAFVKKKRANVVGISCTLPILSQDSSCFFESLSHIKQVCGMLESELGLSQALVDIDSEILDWSTDSVNHPDTSFEEAIRSIRSVLQGHCVIARPSKYLVMASHTLAVNVIARRTVTYSSGEENKDKYLYYVNDGIYGSFNCLVYEKHSVIPHTLVEGEAVEKFKCTIFGPTCDGIDLISEEEHLPKLEVGDWLYFPNMGAFTATSSTAFNGFDLPKFHYFFCA
jgi:ornithine decarboxylase